MSNPILQVNHLVKHFQASSQLFGKTAAVVKAVDDISFSVDEGEIYALVGESGCGKSTTARLILNLIRPTCGDVIFQNRNVFSLPPKEQRAMRRDIQMIFQDPYSSLNPRWRVGSILEEPLDAHGIGTAAERREMVDTMLETVGLDRSCSRRYSHEFSGGQRQRIGIARTLMTRPKLVLCDEPISALDVSIQAQIVNLLKDMQESFNLSYLFITHDLRIVNYLCNRVGVMYLGKLVEEAPKEDIYRQPMHPYTQALFSAIPIPDPDYKKNEIVLEGDVPSPINPPSGCAFHTRCQKAMPVCSEQAPEPTVIDKGHYCACHLYK